MSDAQYIELPPQKKPRQIFPLGWKSVAAVCAVLAALAIGLLYWLLADGKVTSVYARVDAPVYTVGTQFPAMLGSVFVRVGDKVSAGQPLAKLDMAPPPANAGQPAPQAANQRDAAALKAIQERVNAAQMTEKNLTAKLAQARSEEDKYQKIQEESVSAHVRAQLAMRSLDSRSQIAYRQASQTEEAARQAMETAKANYERVSRIRAATNAELNGIRAELARYRQRYGVSGERQPERTPLDRQAPDNLLYSPGNGKIIAVNARPGQELQPGQTAFVVLPDGQKNVSARWVQAWFPLKLREKLKLGQPAAVELRNGLVLRGSIAAIDDEAGTLPPGAAAEGTVNIDAVTAKDHARFEPSRYLSAKIQLDNAADNEALDPGAVVGCRVLARGLAGLAPFLL